MSSAASSALIVGRFGPQTGSPVLLLAKDDDFAILSAIAVLRPLADPEVHVMNREPVAYVISEVEGFVDQAAVRRYGELAGPAFEKYGGHFLISNAVPLFVEG